MKTLIAVLLLMFTFPSILVGSDFKSADQELNRVYQQVLQTYKEQPEFIAKFRAAQKAWLQFRDAHLEAMFPAKDKYANYGSVYPMCASILLSELTEARIKQLRVCLVGFEEGEACSGSVRLKTNSK